MNIIQLLDVDISFVEFAYSTIWLLNVENNNLQTSKILQVYFFSVLSIFIIFKLSFYSGYKIPCPEN